jgi:hypothetical protein
MVFVVVFFFGLCGLLAAWGGYITYDTNPNLYFLQARLLEDAKLPVQPAHLLNMFPFLTSLTWLCRLCRRFPALLMSWGR